MKTYNFHIFPPYIDCYINTLFAENEDLTIDEIKEAMKGHAMDWSDQSIGAAVLRGKDFATYEGRIVLMCAYLYEKTDKGAGNTNCLLASVSREELELLPEDEGMYWWNIMEYHLLDKIPNEDWDVT